MAKAGPAWPDVHDRARGPSRIERSRSPAGRSVRGRFRPPLKAHDQRAGQRLTGRARARCVDALDVHRRAVARGHPQPLALPAGFGIIDAAVHALGEESHRIGDAELDDLAVRERVERVREIAGPDGSVHAQAEDVVLVYPRVVRGFGGAVASGERRTRQRIERPAFGAQSPLTRARPIEASLALSAVEARDVAARERHPRDAAAVDVESAHAVAGRWDSVDFRQRRRRRVGARLKPQDVARVPDVRSPDRAVDRVVGDAVEAEPDTLVLVWIVRLIRLDPGVALAVA